MVRTAKTLIGKPCPKGHTLRYARWGNCVECSIAAVRKYQAKNPEKGSADNKKWRAKNKARKQKTTAAWFSANPDKRREYSARDRAKHPARRYANNAKRRALRRNQVCGCCKPAELVAKYEEARLLGREVDHIVPLALGGLHCLKNLQILTKEAHKVKTRRDRLLIKAARRRA